MSEMTKKSENNAHEGQSEISGKGTANVISITVIVNGTSTIVEANLNEEMHVIAQKALVQTGNLARPLSEWTLKTREGMVIFMEKTVGGYGFANGIQLVLSLEAGVGGNFKVC